MPSRKKGLRTLDNSRVSLNGKGAGNSFEGAWQSILSGSFLIERESAMEGTCLPNWLKKRAELTPDRIAVIYNKQKYTFAQLYERSLSLGGRLYEAGVREGDKVGLLQGNTLDMVLSIHACQQIGAEMVLLNIKLTPNELQWQLEDSGLKFLITEKRYIESIDDRICRFLPIEELSTGTSDYRGFLKDEFNLGGTANIMYTSGTSGKPKGVIHSFGNHWWSAVGSMLNMGLSDKDRWLCSVPLFHISGLSILMRSVIYGITVVLHEKFDETEVNRSIREEEVTIISVVASMLTRMLKDLDEEGYPKTLRCVLLGGGPAPEVLLQQCKRKNIPVYQTYGMTETSSQIVTLQPEYSIRKLGSAGKPLFPSQICIHMDGRQADAGEIGEILVKGPNVTSGYAGRPEATASSFINGWFKTGDAGYLDEDGFLYIVDRRSDLIISGGENIYPAEVENALLSHPSIKEAGVTGRADSKWGEVPVAYIVTNDASITLSDIQKHCGSLLAAYKHPKEIVLVDELPRNASNKLMRRKLKTLVHK